MIKSRVNWVCVYIYCLQNDLTDSRSLNLSITRAPLTLLEHARSEFIQTASLWTSGSVKALPFLAFSLEVRTGSVRKRSTNTVPCETRRNEPDKIARLHSLQARLKQTNCYPVGIKHETSVRIQSSTDSRHRSLKL